MAWKYINNNLTMICLFFFSWFSCYRGWKKKLVHFYLLEMFYDLAIFLTTVGNRARLRAGRRGVSPRPVRSRVRLAVSYFIGFDCFFFSNPSEWLSSLSISSFRSKESKKKKVLIGLLRFLRLVDVVRGSTGNGVYRVFTEFFFSLLHVGPITTK